MNYISLSFMLFCLIGTIIYFNVSKRIQTWVLLLLNIFFYIYADYRYIFYLAFTIILTFFTAYIVDKTGSRKVKKYTTVCGVFICVAILFAVKYFTCASNLLGNITLGRDIVSLKLLVPLGISFYTLQAISYCLDVYNGKINCEKNIVKYAVYLSYFPTIVQGPIVRYSDFEKQFAKKHCFDYVRVKEGLQIVLYGLFKKLVIADRAALFVNDVWTNYANYGKSLIVFGVILYSIQIYMDFSGCVDICRGISKVLGIHIVNNFNAPYFATSIKDFWRRWHISLSTWLRDYVYIPLGGNRKGKFRRYINLLITFFISGLWHGVGLNYMVWGLLHGLYQIFGEMLLPFRKRFQKKFNVKTEVFSYRAMECALTFVLVSFSWIFFRSNGLREAINIIKAIKNNQWIMSFAAQKAIDQKDLFVLFWATIIVFFVSYFQQKYSISKWINQQNIWFRWGVYFAVIFCIMIFGIYGSGYNAETFIYMQF